MPLTHGPRPTFTGPLQPVSRRLRRTILPGPGEYETSRSCFGAPLRARAAATGGGGAAIGFGSSASRPPLARPTPSRGAIYRSEASVGRQVTSTRPKAPSVLVGGGTASREDMERQYVRRFTPVV